MAERKAPKGHDLYPTPRLYTRAFLSLPFISELLRSRVGSGRIWEPACGLGWMSEVLQEFGYKTISTDIQALGYGQVHDFLWTPSVPWETKAVITNPPYVLANEFVLTASAIPQVTLTAFFLRTAWGSEGSERYEKIFSEHPYQYEFCYTNRCTLFPAGDARAENPTGGKVAYSWFVWDKLAEGIDQPIKFWIPPLKPLTRRQIVDRRGDMQTQRRHRTAYGRRLERKT